MLGQSGWIPVDDGTLEDDVYNLTGIWREKGKIGLSSGGSTYAWREARGHPPVSARRRACTWLLWQKSTLDGETKECLDFRIRQWNVLRIVQCDRTAYIRYTSLTLLVLVLPFLSSLLLPLTFRTGTAPPTNGSSSRGFFSSYRKDNSATTDPFADSKSASKAREKEKASAKKEAEDKKKKASRHADAIDKLDPSGFWGTGSELLGL